MPITAAIASTVITFCALVVIFIVLLANISFYVLVLGAPPDVRTWPIWLDSILGLTTALCLCGLYIAATTD